MGTEAKVEPVVVPISEVAASIRDKLNDLCHQKREIADNLRAWKSADEAVSDEIKQLARQVPADKVVGDRWQLVKSVQRRTSIDAKKLIEKGVGWDVIQAATVVTETATVSVLDYDPK